MMSKPLRIYNTISRKVEEFVPFERDIVKMYVCGPTVYDYSHVGHGRVYVVFDAFKRYLKLRGYQVIHVMNITDIDDKIIDKASVEGVSWKDLANRYVPDFLNSLIALNVKADLYPRVSEHIDDIVRFIQSLIEKGYAYAAKSGSVYFDVDKYSDYGQLSGKLNKSLWSQEPGFLKEKKHPYDFALWKSVKPGEPYWESPWGNGRPGWHIECSAMSSKYLGKRFDIHGGGADLVFPHHENERAQSEAAFSVKPWVKYWMHVGLLKIGKDKMSKSLGNVIPLKDAIKQWNPKALRLFYLTLHYRKPQVFSEKGIRQAEKLYNRLSTSVTLLKKLVNEGKTDKFRMSDEDLNILRDLLRVRDEFHEALSNDFNTPKALAAIIKLTDIVFRDIQFRDSYALSLKSLQLMEEFNTVLGVLDKELYGFVGVNEELLNEVIDLIVDVRKRLRARKEYELTDEIRKELERLGVVLLDKGLETKWVLRKGKSSSS